MKKSAVFSANHNTLRQFVQRRGRVLRPYEDKIARIHDILVVPPSGMLEDKVERRILQTELRRALVFSRNARNKTDIDIQLQVVASKYGIDLSEMSVE